MRHRLKRIGAGALVVVVVLTWLVLSYAHYTAVAFVGVGGADARVAQLLRAGWRINRVESFGDRERLVVLRRSIGAYVLCVVSSPAPC